MQNKTKNIITIIIIMIVNMGRLYDDKTITTLSKNHQDNSDNITIIKHR